jgi:hypothetical protein
LGTERKIGIGPQGEDRAGVTDMFQERRQTGDKKGRPKRSRGGETHATEFERPCQLGVGRLGGKDITVRKAKKTKKGRQDEAIPLAEMDL